MYSRYHKIIKCVAFEPFHYVINLNVVLSFRVFSKFVSVFLSNVLLV